MSETVATKSKSAERVVRIVSRAYGVSAEKLLAHTKSRQSGLMEARFVGIYLVRVALNETWDNAGAAFDRTRATAISAAEIVERRMIDDPGFERLIKALSNHVQDSN